jgi:replicative DNA helicase Mcm
MQATSGFSADTEILTRRGGWVTFDQLLCLDEVATRTLTGRFQWHNPSRVICQRYTGPMLHFRSQVYNLMVAPAHLLPTYRRQKPDRQWNGILEFKAAGYFSDGRSRGRNHRIPLTSQWDGTAPETIVIPAAPRLRGRHHPAPELRFPVETWMRFLGWFLSEGWLTDTVNAYNVVGIAQIRETHRPHIRETLEAMGMPFREGTTGFEFNHGPLRRWLWAASYNGKGHRAWHKMVPLSVREYPSDLLAVMFDAMMRGDGHTEKTGLRRYLTTSRTLADDVVEVLQKMGKQGWYEVVRFANGTTIGGTRVKSKRTQYRVTERPGEGSAVPVPSPVPYSGAIYNVRVPNELIYVRREGRTTWCAADLVT